MAGDWPVVQDAALKHVGVGSGLGVMDFWCWFELYSTNTIDYSRAGRYVVM